MAVPTYHTDLVLMTDAESGTWTEFTPYSSGGTPAAETDFYIQGSGCYSQSFGTKTGLVFSIVYDAGSGAPIPSGSCIFLWQVLLAGNAMETYENGGIRVGIGSSITAISSYATGGSNFGRNPYGGWQNVVVDPRRTGDYLDGGGNGGTWRYIGSIMNTTAQISKGNPHGVDVIRYGRGEFAIENGSLGDGAATFASMSIANDAQSARWGLFSLQGGSYIWKGLMKLGSATASVYFKDANKTIAIENTPKTYPTFNKIVGYNTGSVVAWTNISFNALGTYAPGLLEMVDDIDFTSDGCTFQNMNTFIFKSNSNVINSIFQSCNQVTASGSVFTNTKVQSSTAAVDGYALKWDSATDPDGYLDNMFFSRGANAHHAIAFSTIAPLSITLRGIEFSGFATSHAQNSSALYVARTTGSVTINLVGCSGDIYYKTAGAVVSLVIDPVTLKITVIDADTSLPVQFARVLVEVASGVNFPYQASVTITGSGTTATVSHTAHGLSTNDNVVIRGANEDVYNGVYTITKINDNSYSYTTNETIGSSPATGTITATMALINGETDVNGEISDTRSYSNNQPITGKVRRASNGVYYRSSSIADTVSNTSGKDINVQLIPDV